MELFNFKDTPPSHWAVSATDQWKILVIDDESSIHEITQIVLKDFHFDGKPLLLLHAYSTQDAKKMLTDHTDIALILLDIILETQTAGLDLIHWIRKQANNTLSQIIIRTGNPDHYPEAEMIETYTINDYVEKTNVTAQRLKTLVMGSIRTFRDKYKLKQELSAKRKIEQSLKEKEKLLEDIVENIGDILWEIDEKLIYTYISKKAEAITGFAATHFIGKSFQNFLTAESKTIAFNQIKSHIVQQTKFSNIEITRNTKSGEPQYYLVSGKPFFKGDKFKGYRGADIDITSLKRTEIEKDKLIAELRQAQRLEAMGTLAGGIAHDFNNILGGILGYAQLLQFELNENPTSMSYTKQIVTGCNRAKNLIFQILDFSRQRDNVSSKRLTNPIEIVNETLKLLRASFPSSIKIRSTVYKDTGCIQADPSQIHQAVMNLCTNARQAIEDGRGEVHIIVNEIAHAVDAPIADLKLDLPFGDYIMISVEDTGKGIDIDALDKIFNPYFTTKKHGDGTGLGLSVVHGIVTRFNGAITTRTKPGQGTIFALYFPKYAATEETKKQTYNPLIKGNAHVLFIDDEPMLVDLGKRMLEKLGYHVEALESALEALSMIKEKPTRFDLVITDMTMPDMYGTKLAEEIKKINDQIPIVLASGFSTLSQTSNANPSGIDAVLPKPIEISTLSQTLHQLLNKAL